MSFQTRPLSAAGLCAYTVLGKFGDHQPLYRQEDIHSRMGMTIRRSTLCGWQATLADKMHFTVRSPIPRLSNNETNHRVQVLRT